MANMWSDKKWVNITINVLLFLVAINFVHLGQLLLPIICLILFIDNKFKFKVNSVFTFVVLCLFAISFCTFSYKLGFYCVMGFCLPMAYYIGSNLKEVNEENIKKVIYIIAFGMAVHILLNFILDYKVFGIALFRKNKHYDIWLNDIIQSTGIASNCLLIISLFYYLLTYEKTKFYKIVGIVLFVICFIYNIGLGRRTPLFIFVLIFIISLFVDSFIFRSTNIKKKSILIMIISILFILILLFVFYQLNLFDMKRIVGDITLYQKFVIDGLDPKRFDIFSNSIKYMPYYLWGGQNISNVLGIQVHDLWMDIYDYAGIIPFTLIVVYTIEIIVRFIRIMKNKMITNKTKLLLIETYGCIGILMFLEPAMTGVSIFLIASIIIITVSNKLEQ